MARNPASFAVFPGGITGAVITSDRSTPVANTYIDLRFTDARGREQAARAITDPEGWIVEASLNGEQFWRRCRRWQAVERTLLWLRRHAHEAQPDRYVQRLAAAVALLMVLGGAGAAFAQMPSPESSAVQAFVTAARDYAAMHRRLESNLPRLTVTADPATISRAVHDMADALRVARAGAQPGEFFTEPVAAEIRTRIAEALAANHLAPDDVRAAEAAEGIEPAFVTLKVNGEFPWRYATTVFPCVLNALPPLPPELQYRIVGNTLVLIDVHASLIVDLLPYALADTER